MKGFLFVLLTFFAISCIAQSQPCNIDYAAINSGFMYPPTDTLACIEQGTPYNETIQINMPGMFHGIVLLDSMFIDSITGLPSGIHWQSYPSSPLVLDGDSSGCIAFSGTSNADSGSYSLTFYCHATVTSQSAGTENLSYQQLMQIGDAPIPFYQLNVIPEGDSCHPQLYLTGVTSLSGNSNWSIYPNPLQEGSAREQLVVSDDLVGSEIEIFDEGGRLIHRSTIRSAYSEIELKAAPGIYLAHIHSANNSAVKKIVKL